MFFKIDVLELKTSQFHRKSPVLKSPKKETSVSRDSNDFRVLKRDSNAGVFL